MNIYSVDERYLFDETMLDAAQFTHENKIFDLMGSNQVFINEVAFYNTDRILTIQTINEDEKLHLYLFNHPLPATLEYLASNKNMWRALRHYYLSGNRYDLSSYPITTAIILGALE